MRLLTSRFNYRGVAAHGLPVGIVLGFPEWPTPAERRNVDALAPLPWMRGVKGDQFRAYYRKHLDGLGPEKIREAIRAVAGDAEVVVLLCYEDLRKPESSCHRRMFAEWWKEKTGEEVEEVVEVAAEEPGPKQLRLF